MTDIKKAIKFAEGEIKSLELAPKINGCEMTEWWKEQIEVWKTAISALEKQIPKKPISVKRFTGTTTANCSVCNGKVLKVNYCQRCGQALDWSDTK